MFTTTPLYIYSCLRVEWLAGSDRQDVDDPYQIMSSSELLSAVRAIVPTLVHASHKGMAGRVGVIGGSLE